MNYFDWRQEIEKQREERWLWHLDDCMHKVPKMTDPSAVLKLISVNDAEHYKMIRISRNRQQLADALIEFNKIAREHHYKLTGARLR